MIAQNVTCFSFWLSGILLLSSACIQDPTAQLSSFVSDKDLTPLENATISIVTLDEIEFSSTTSLADGSFSIDLPAFQTFFAVVSHPDRMTSSFTGISGEGHTEVEEGFLVLESSQTFLERAALYTDCNIVENFIEGEVRIAIPEQETEILPIVTTARAIAFDADLTPSQACYVDPTEDPPRTGETGRYLFTEKKQGIYEILLNVQYDAQTQVEYTYLVYVPEKGRASLFPTLIPL